MNLHLTPPGVFRTKRLILVFHLRDEISTSATTVSLSVPDRAAGFDARRNGQAVEKATSPRTARENQRPKLATSVVKKVILYVYPRKSHISCLVILAPSQSRECPQTDTPSGNIGQECYKCGKVGHIARNCTSGGSGGNYSYGGGGGGGGGGGSKTW